MTSIYPLLTSPASAILAIASSRLINLDSRQRSSIYSSIDQADKFLKG